MARVCRTRGRGSRSRPEARWFHGAEPTAWAMDPDMPVTARPIGLPAKDCLTRSDPRGRVGWRAHPNPPRCHTGHRNRGVATVIGLKARTASVLRHTLRNPNTASNLRDRQRARPNRVFAHTHVCFTCAPLDRHRACRKPPPCPTKPPRTRRVSSPALIPALLGAPGVRAGRSAIRYCRTAAAGHPTRPRSPAVRSCGSSSSRSPSAAPPRAGRCARTSDTTERALGWRPTPNYRLPPRPRSFRERRESTNPLLNLLEISDHPIPPSFRVRQRKTPAKVSSAVCPCHNKLNPPPLSSSVRLPTLFAKPIPEAACPAARGGAAWT